LGGIGQFEATWESGHRISSYSDIEQLETAVLHEPIHVVECVIGRIAGSVPIHLEHQAENLKLLQCRVKRIEDMEVSAVHVDLDEIDGANAAITQELRQVHRVCPIGKRGLLPEIFAS
jgi:hypothetical protein